MNIIYCGCFRLPHYDAAAPRVLNNARAMHALGHQVLFISWGGEYQNTDLCEDGKYSIDGMEYIVTNELDQKGTLLCKFYNLLHRGDKTIEILNSIPRKPDLIIMYNADFYWTKRMIRYCKKNNIKLANDITEWYNNNELHFWDIIPNYINMTYLQRKVSNKICISTYLKDYYCESNNLLLPPLCNHSDSKWKTNIEDERVKSFNGITIIYAGNPAKKDCVHTVINTVNKLAHEGKSIRFLILGVTRDIYIKRYHKMIDANDLHENILFLGRVSQDKIPAYYKKADFMVLLRKTIRKNMAGFPTKFAESLSAGIPVIANITCDLGNYIIDGHTGFVLADESANSLEKAIHKVLTLSRVQVEKMKRETKIIAPTFDFTNWKDEIKLFLENLK